jgi:phosphoribosyl 1,2-cyclic phosphodiesterase
MTTPYIKLINVININTQQEVCSQYNNRKVDYSKSVIKIGEALKIVDTDGIFFSHEQVEDIQDGFYGFNVITTRKVWSFEYCDEKWNNIGGEN